MSTQESQTQARVVVRRNSESDSKIRSIFVSVDGRSEKALNFGDSAQLQVKPGQHELKATNRLFTRRVAIDLASGETAVFVVANRSGGCLLFLAAAIGAGAFKLSVERVPDEAGSRSP